MDDSTRVLVRPNVRDEPRPEGSSDIGSWLATATATARRARDLDSVVRGYLSPFHPDGRHWEDLIGVDPGGEDVVEEGPHIP